MTLTNTISQYVLAKFCRLLVGVVWSRMPDQSTNFRSCLSIIRPCWLRGDVIQASLVALRTFVYVNEEKRTMRTNSKNLRWRQSLSHSCQESPRREKIHETSLVLNYCIQLVDVQLPQTIVPLQQIGIYRFLRSCHPFSIKSIHPNNLLSLYIYRQQSCVGFILAP